MATATKAAGCYKCGKTGHWARDCPAPPSEWVNKQPFPAGGAGGQKAAGGGSAAAPPQDGSGENHPANDQQQQQQLGALPKLGGGRKKKPKVNFELLTGQGGMDDVHDNFPSAFRAQFKGRGHEVGDLRRLLEMYKRWQERLFPHCDFDTFIVSVEKLSGVHGIKHEMLKRREKLLMDVQDALRPPQEDPAAAEAGPEGAEAGGDGYLGFGGEPLLPEEAGGFDDDDDIELGLPEDDDEMLDPEALADYFQAADQQQQQGGGAAGPAGGRQGREEEEEIELGLPSDDEMDLNDDELALADQVDDGAAGVAGAADGGGAQQGQEEEVELGLPSDDEDDAGLAFEDAPEFDGGPEPPLGVGAPAPAEAAAAAQATPAGGQQQQEQHGAPAPPESEAAWAAAAGETSEPTEAPVATLGLGTEASGVGVTCLGTEEVVGAAFRQFAALQETQASQLEPQGASLGAAEEAELEALAAELAAAGSPGGS